MHKVNSENYRQDDYRISIVSRPILGVPYQIVSVSVVSGKIRYYVQHRASLQVRQLLMGCITQDGHRALVP